jgi:hypothetical protein
VPVLAGWADLDQREADADIEEGHPILIDPEFRIDPVLARFLSRSRFTWLAEGTLQSAPGVQVRVSAACRSVPGVVAGGKLISMLRPPCGPGLMARAAW